MIDGTDLVYRKMSNWCSALVFFDPQAKKILASVVGLPSGSFYCAADGVEPFLVKVTSRAHEAPLHQLDSEIPIRPNKRRRLKDATVCFYGQKAENLLSIIEKACGLPDYLRKISLLPKGRRPPCRFYNLGGNPMICKVADGSVDAVFELVGQKPHDVVPSAFIARCAGAVVKDLDNNALPLEESLLTPNVGKLRYIVAATESLYQELREQVLRRPKRSRKTAA
jgi:fructose-1,6-bisphosphatase/inositol monophosphatase family enzyme